MLILFVYPMVKSSQMFFCLLVGIKVAFFGKMTSSTVPFIQFAMGHYVLCSQQNSNLII